MQVMIHMKLTMHLGQLRYLRHGELKWLELLKTDLNLIYAI